MTDYSFLETEKKVVNKRLTFTHKIFRVLSIYLFIEVENYTVRNLSII